MTDTTSIILDAIKAELKRQRNLAVPNEWDLELGTDPEKNEVVIGDDGMAGLNGTFDIFALSQAIARALTASQSRQEASTDTKTALDLSHTVETKEGAVERD